MGITVMPWGYGIWGMGIWHENGQWINGVSGSSVRNLGDALAVRGRDMG